MADGVTKALWLDKFVAFRDALGNQTSSRKPHPKVLGAQAGNHPTACDYNGSTRKTHLRRGGVGYVRLSIYRAANFALPCSRWGFPIQVPSGELALSVHGVRSFLRSIPHFGREGPLEGKLIVWLEGEGVEYRLAFEI